jgi:hypothetical protein
VKDQWRTKLSQQNRCLWEEEEQQEQEEEEEMIPNLLSEAYLLWIRSHASPRFLLQCCHRAPRFLHFLLPSVRRSWVLLLTIPERRII